MATYDKIITRYDASALIPDQKIVSEIIKQVTEQSTILPLFSPAIKPPNIYAAT